MPENECIPLFEPADRVTGQVLTPTRGCRFCSALENPLSGPGIPATAQVGASDPVDGANFMVGYAPAGARALGVSAWDALLPGEKVGLICEGVVPVKAGANLSAGTTVAVGAEGQAVAAAAEGTAATLETGVVVNNNRIKWTAATPGAHAGLKVVLAVAGASTPLSVTVAGEVITVHVGTNSGSAAISTANEVIAKVNETAAALALLSAANGLGSSGEGVVAAVAETALAGGTSPTADVGLVVIGGASGELIYVKLHC